MPRLTSNKSESVHWCHLWSSTLVAFVQWMREMQSWPDQGRFDHMCTWVICRISLRFKALPNLKNEQLKGDRMNGLIKSPRQGGFSCATINETFLRYLRFLWLIKYLSLHELLDLELDLDIWFALSNSKTLPLINSFSKGPDSYPEDQTILIAITLHHPNLSEEAQLFHGRVHSPLFSLVDE